jgi:uncharacterized repeat protein (TIGR01451 family)
MWKKRFDLLKVGLQMRWLLLVLLTVKITALNVWAVELPQAIPLVKETIVVNKSITAVDVDADGPDLGQNGPSVPNAATPWRIHFYAVPGADGTSLFVSTGQTTELATTVTCEVEVGEARYRHGMSYSIEETAYETLIGGVFAPGPSTVEGTIGLSTDLDDDETLDTGPVFYRRFFVPTTGAAPLVSDDNNLEMTLSDNSLPADAYALVMSTNAIPGPLPPGHQTVGQPYSVRASGANPTSMNPMLLKLFYTDTTLGNIDPHTLSILQWSPVSREWDDLAGNLDDLVENSVTTTTDRFTVYALMSAPHWRDGFNDFTGLSEWDHVTVLLPHGDLVLDGLDYTGTATSRVVTPAIAIDEWGFLTFSSTVPSGTSLTVDVLSADGTLLLGDVTSGSSLTSIDPTIYPSLKLQATFSTDDLAYSASLQEWTVTWQPMSPHLSIGKHAIPGSVFPGDLLTYTIVVSETGGSIDVTGAQVTDTVPANTTCCTSIGQNGIPITNAVSWSGLTITRGQSVSLTFAVTVGQVSSGTVITNDAYRVVASDQGVTTSAGSAANTTVWQPMLPNLSIGKYAIPGPVFPGDLLTYTIVVSETGGSVDVTGVQVTDTVPASTIYAWGGQGGTLTIDTNTAIWSGLTITKGQSINLTFVVTVGQVPSGTVITNDAYRVVASDQGVTTGLGSTVYTTVWEPGWKVYLPIIMRQ